MAAATSLGNPAEECCPTGLKHEGKAAGRIETVASYVQTYISDPPANITGPKKVILFFSDLDGPFHMPSQLLQDYFASFGFCVLGIDYLFGDYVSDNCNKAGFDIESWTNMKIRPAREETPMWISQVRRMYGEDAEYFAVGYGFGAPYAIELAATDKIIAAALVHPTHVQEDHFRDVKKPLVLSCAESDFTFPPRSRHKAEAILAKTKATYHVQLFSGVEHGFSTGGDLAVENNRWAREQCARSVIDWFKRFSSK